VSLHVVKMLQDLSQNEIDFILDDSVTDSDVAEIAITPSLDVDNLHRLARYFDRFQVKPLSLSGTYSDSRSERWSPYPVSVRKSNGIFITPNGRLRVIIPQRGTFQAQKRDSLHGEVHGIRVRVSRQMKGFAQTIAPQEPEKQPSEKRGQTCVLADTDVAAVNDICRAQFGEDIKSRFIESIIVEPGYRSAIFRCRVKGPSAGVPETIVVKRSNRGQDNVFNEWAAFEFLGRFSKLSPVIPRFYGGSAKAGLIVMEDFGDIREIDLASHLLNGDVNVTKNFLIRFAEQIGNVHGVTAAHQHEFQKIRKTLHIQVVRMLDPMS
jgi:hypothetical protein